MNQEYIMECKECGQQVEQRGNAAFMCRRCRRSVEIKPDGTKEILEPEGDEILRAERGMSKPAKVFFVPESAEEDEESEESEDEEEGKVVRRSKKRPEKKKEFPNDDEMVAFLIATAKETGGDRRALAKAKKTEDEMANIDEDDPVEKVLPVAKEATKRPPAPKPNPTVEKPSCPEVKEKKIKVVELKPGQTFYSHELGIMFVGIE